MPTKAYVNRAAPYKFPVPRLGVRPQSELHRLILEDGPLHFWPLDDAPGVATARDLGSGAFSPAINGAPIRGYHNLRESGMLFDGGSADGVREDFAHAYASGAFTMGIWLKPTQMVTHSNVFALGALGGGGRMRGIIRYDGSTPTGQCIYFWGDSVDIAGDTDFTPNKWQGIFIRYDETTLYLYKDRTIVGQGNISLIGNTGGTVAIAEEMNTGFQTPLKGAMFCGFYTESDVGEDRLEQYIRASGVGI
jgi:hypothetical protein